MSVEEAVSATGIVVSGEIEIVLSAFSTITERVTVAVFPAASIAR